MATAEHSTGSLLTGNVRRARTTGALRGGIEGECVSVWRADRTAPALVVDHPLRDLAGLTFVAAEMALSEGAALLIPMYRQVSLFEWARPRVLLVNYVYPTNHSLRLWAHERGVPVAVLETEGAPYREIKATVASIVGDPDFGRITRFFMWSDAMLKAFREAWPETKPPRFSVTGHPRFDLLAEPLRSQALSNKGSRLVILFATSFATFNGFASQTPAGVIMGYWRSMRSRDLEGLNWLPQEAMRLMFTLKAVRAVAEAYPDATVVIRPHPFEEHELYSMGFSDLPNVEINSRGSSMEAISGADVFFHCRSNTGFEARALGVPAASLVPDRSPQTLPVDKTSTELSTIDEVMRFVKNAFEGTADQPLISDEEFEFALGAHRGSSTQRVAEALLEIANRTTSEPSIMRLPHKRWIREWEAVLRKRWVADDRERRKAFFAADVQEWLNRWSASHNRRRLRARNVIGRPLIDPPVMIGGAPLAVEVTPA